MEENLRSRLLALNPWFQRPVAFAEELARRLPARFVPRIFDMRGVDDTSRAKLVVGPRQAGKSSWLWHHLRDRPPQEVLYIDAEEALVRRWASSAVQVVADLGDELPQVRTVYIEEAQNLEDAGLLVKGLVDSRRSLDVFVTGSSSYHLASRTRESLAGRAVRRHLLPLSLSELVDAEGSPVPAVRRQAAQRFLARQMVIGGYPGVWSHPDPALVLSDLVEAFVLRDASDRFRIQRPDAFRHLLELVAGQVGQMANYAEWASHLGVSANTVRDWLGLLEETWILCRVPPFAGGKRREITGAPRVHFYDMGVRNRLLGALDPDVTRRPDRGALAEGWAFGELAKRLGPDWTIHYWRSTGGAEMDFVLVWGDRKIGVEVKAGRPGLSRSVRSFMTAYRPEAVLLASPGHGVTTREPLDGTLVVTCDLADLGAIASELTTAG